MGEGNWLVSEWLILHKYTTNPVNEKSTWTSQRKHAKKQKNLNFIFLPITWHRMVLNGVNMPLSFIGQEYVWTEVYKQVLLPHSFSFLLPSQSSPPFPYPLFSLSLILFRCRTVFFCRLYSFFPWLFLVFSNILAGFESIWHCTVFLWSCFFAMATYGKFGRLARVCLYV